MKIRRLNENLETEPWTMEKFEKIDNLKKEIKAEEESLHDLLIKYIQLNPQLTEEVRGNPGISIEDIEFENIYIVNYFFSKGSTIRCQIVFNDCTADEDDNYNMNLTKNEFDDLLHFLKDSNAYKQAKKYNL